MASLTGGAHLLRDGDSQCESNSAWSVAFCGSLKVKVAPREEAETLTAAILALFLPIKGEHYEPK
ncbi:MAG: hypothetical protein ABSC01_04495 [Verrucomicrobiota bacterium]